MPEQVRLTPEEALARGLALVQPLAEAEDLPLAQAMGRVLAQPALAQGDLPPFNAAAMDGYAFRISDLQGSAPWHLPLAAGGGAAGDAPMALPPGRAMRALTGAPVPAGADCVIMQENIRLAADEIEIAALPARDNIRPMGEDFRNGAEVLPSGRLIGPPEALLLAASGNGILSLRRKVRVAMFCTGSELTAPGNPLGPGQIWNSNRAHLLASLSLPWIELTDLGDLPDRPDTLTAAMAEAATRADLILTTGGTAVGDEDHMAQVFEGLGGQLEVLSVAMKPGKPLMLGRLDKAVWLGLPGTPLAALVGMRIFALPLLAALAGTAMPGPRAIQARAGFRSEPTGFRREYRLARIAGLDPQGLPLLEPTTPRYSNMVMQLATADGFAVIPAFHNGMLPGDALEFLPFAR